tara:strand:- start:954 stop:1166 length:213 start_codon:yes stop_codon:yes gene_type:complete
MFKCNSCNKEAEAEAAPECCGVPMVEVQAEAPAAEAEEAPAAEAEEAPAAEAETSEEAPAEEEKKEESSE